MRRHFPLMWLALYRRRRMLIALCAGIALFEVLIVAIVVAIPADSFFSAGKSTDAFQSFSGSNSLSLASTAGLLGAGFVHPIWVAIMLSAVASFGAATVAADIEDRTMELIAVRPLSRVRLLSERVGAGILATALLNIAAIAPVIVGVLTSDRLHSAIAASGFIFGFMAGFVLLLAFTGVAVFLSCTLRRRAAVLSGVSGFAAVMYALNFVAQSWSAADFTKWVSLFYYYRPADAMVSGDPQWRNYAVLLTVFVVTLVAGVWRLRTRDLTR